MKTDKFDKFEKCKNCGHYKDDHSFNGYHCPNNGQGIYRGFSTTKVFEPKPKTNGF